MASLIDENTQFLDSAGTPIVNGYLYVGTVNLDPVTNTITIYSDSALSVPISNPQRTDAYGRSTNKIYVPGTYSLKVEDENNVQQYLELDNGTAATAAEQIKISANDTTAGYLNGKLTAGTNVTLTENNNGGNEDLEIDIGAAGILIDESADHNNTPTAGKLEIWAKNDTPNSLYFTDGAGTDSIILKTTVLEIGDWDMDTTASVNVAHGLILANIRSIRVTIRNDTDTLYTDLGSASDETDQGCGANGTNAVLNRVTAGIYDNANYDSTSYNRGWIIINHV